MLNGIYQSEKDDNIWNQHKIVMDVKETEKSFVFRLIELKSRYRKE